MDTATFQQRSGIMIALLNIEEFGCRQIAQTFEEYVEAVIAWKEGKGTGEAAYAILDKLPDPKSVPALAQRVIPQLIFLVAAYSWGGTFEEMKTKTVT